MLARPANKIIVGDIVRTLDGPLAPIACASRSSYRPCDDCADQTSCAVRLMMLEVREAMANVLDHRLQHRASLVGQLRQACGVSFHQVAHDHMRDGGRRDADADRLGIGAEAEQEHPLPRREACPDCLGGRNLGDFAYGEIPAADGRSAKPLRCRRR